MLPTTVEVSHSSRRKIKALKTLSSMLVTLCAAVMMHLVDTYIHVMRFFICMRTCKLTAMFMNDTNFLRTAIISEKLLEGISL